MSETKETIGKRLNFDEGDKDDRGQLRNLVLLIFGFVKYRIYVW